MTHTHTHTYLPILPTYATYHHIPTEHHKLVHCHGNSSHLERQNALDGNGICLSRWPPLPWGAYIRPHLHTYTPYPPATLPTTCSYPHLPYNYLPHTHIPPHVHTWTETYPQSLYHRYVGIVQFLKLIPSNSQHLLQFQISDIDTIALAGQVHMPYLKMLESG